MQSYFEEDFLRALRTWRQRGEELIVSGDFNDHIYNSPLARAFRSEEIGLIEQFHQLYGEAAPYSHFRGTTPINGVFSTAGAQCR